MPADNQRSADDGDDRNLSQEPSSRSVHKTPVTASVSVVFLLQIKFIRFDLLRGNRYQFSRLRHVNDHSIVHTATSELWGKPSVHRPIDARKAHLEMRAKLDWDWTVGGSVDRPSGAAAED